MYLKFYGLRENPFSLSSDPRFLYYSASHCEALAHMLYAVQQRKGLTLLVGDPGTGKTLLIRRALEMLRTWGWVTSTVILNPAIREPEELLESLLHGFGVPTFSPTLSSMHRVLENQFVECVSAGKLPVLIVDESQGLRRTLLEQLRLISNVEHRGHKLLQILLVGQKEFEEKIAAPQLSALRQRIAMRCELRPLRLEEVKAYLQFRMNRAGATDTSIFENDACSRMYLYSGGTPRLLNAIADNCLLTGYVQQQQRIGKNLVDTAADRLQLLPLYDGAVAGDVMPLASERLVQASEAASVQLNGFATALKSAGSVGSTQQSTRKGE